MFGLDIFPSQLKLLTFKNVHRHKMRLLNKSQIYFKMKKLVERTLKVHHLYIYMRKILQSYFNFQLESSIYPIRYVCMYIYIRIHSCFRLTFLSVKKLTYLILIWTKIHGGEENREKNKDGKK